MTAKKTKRAKLPATLEELAEAGLRRHARADDRRQELEGLRAAELRFLRLLVQADEAYLGALANTVECALECAALNDLEATDALVAGVEHERRMRLEAPLVVRAQQALGQLSGYGAASVVFKFFSDVLGQVERGEVLPEGLRRVLEVLGLAKGPVLTHAGKQALTVLR